MRTTVQHGDLLSENATPSYVEKIVAAFGGIRAMARILEKPPSTVRSWMVRGSMRDEEKAMVYTKAQGLGLGLTKEDFFPIIDQKDVA